MISKEKYREFCKQEKDIPIFSKDWWLDSVCGNNWNVVLLEKGGQIVASLPYYLVNRKGFSQIVMPPLTQTMGIYIKYPQGQKYYKRLSWEKKIINELIRKLPKHQSFNQSFHHSFTNWLPFYWLDFCQTTRYTYVIENMTIESLEKNFETAIRRRGRRKALEVGVEVFESDDLQKFYELNKMTFARQNMIIPYSYNFIKNLYEKCKDNNSVKMYFARDNEKNVIAANFLVYDKNTVYYLMGGIDPDKGDLGGMDIVQFESIKFALSNGKNFDFEGSMIESIETYFRSFGAVQKPYFNISKTNSKLLNILKCAKQILK